MNPAIERSRQGSRIQILILVLVGTVVTMMLPAASAYLEVRQAIADIRDASHVLIALGRLSSDVSRAAVEYIDITLLAEDRDQLDEFLAAARADLSRLRAPAAFELSQLSTSASLEEIDKQVQELERYGERILEIAKSESPMRVSELTEDFQTSTYLPLIFAIDRLMLGKQLAMDRSLRAVAQASGSFRIIPGIPDSRAQIAPIHHEAAVAYATAKLSSLTARYTTELIDVTIRQKDRKDLFAIRGVLDVAFHDWKSRVVDSAPQLESTYAEWLSLADELLEMDSEPSLAASEVFEAFEIVADEALHAVMDAELERTEQRMAATIEAEAESLGRSTLILGLVMAGVMGMGIACFLLVRRWLLVPIEALTLATRRFADDRQSRVSPEIGGDLRELAVRFNQMASEIEESERKALRDERLRVLGELAGSVGHEIRNPLGAIKNSIYFLKLTEKNLGAKGQEHLDLMNGSIDNADQIVAELLDYARDTPPEHSRFDLKASIEQALIEAQVPSNIKVETEWRMEPLLVLGSPGRIMRAAANLIRNAYQSMPMGGDLRVSIRRDKDNAEVSITDTGTGISAEQLPRIFEPLFSTKARGLGLGLSIAQRYCEQNRGRLRVESAQGAGSCFRMILPLASEDECHDLE